MAPVTAKRRRTEDETRPKKKFKKVKKQAQYHSSSEDEEDLTTGAPQASDAPKAQLKHELKAQLPVTKLQHRPAPLSKPKSALKPQPEKPAKDIVAVESDADDDDDEDAEGIDELERNTGLNAVMAQDDEDENLDEEEGDDEPDIDIDSDADSESDPPSESEASITSSQATRNMKKRNDPSAFATSISKILDTKLSTAKRSDPVLSRSKSASDANKEIADSKLEAKARAQIRAEKRAASERGRVRDVLGLDTEGVDTGKMVEEEKRLKKTAQRGVLQLFNAVRAVQVRGEEARRQAREEGTVGMQKREERVNEMSKQGFLDLLSSGGKKAAA